MHRAPLWLLAIKFYLYNPAIFSKKRYCWVIFMLGQHWSLYTIYNIEICIDILIFSDKHTYHKKELRDIRFKILHRLYNYRKKLFN